MSVGMIELLVGNIASGKSTWSKKRAKDGAIILNDDAIVMAVHGGNYRLYDRNLKDLYKGLEDVAIHLALAKGRDVVIDRPCMSRMTRLHYVSIAKRLDVPIVAVTFDRATPAEHARRRFESDSRGTDYEKWLEVATHMDKIYQEPGYAEGFDNIVNQEVAETMRSNAAWSNGFHSQSLH